MCYLIAKKVDDIGSVALQTDLGQRLVDLKKSLIEKVGYDRIQLVTISRPSAYGEYEPYCFAENEEDFIKAVERM